MSKLDDYGFGCYYHVVEICHDHWASTGDIFVDKSMAVKFLEKHLLRLDVFERDHPWDHYEIKEIWTTLNRLKGFRVHLETE